MSSESENSDSSLDSDGHLYLGTMENFRIKRGRVRAKYAMADNTNSAMIRRMSKIHGCKEENWDTSTLERFRVRATAKNWTKLFLSEDIVLQGQYECANLLRRSPCVSSNPVIIAADAFFPYCSDQDRKVNGYKVGEVQNARMVTIVHLSNSTSRQLTLDAGEVYLIGGLYDPRPYCHVCRESHDLDTTPCAQALRFMPLPPHSHFNKQIFDREQAGPRMLTLITGEPSKLQCHPSDEELCKDCRQKAADDGGMWFRMDGSCEDKLCPNNEWCECWDENEPDSGLCAHYIYVKQWTYNNLAEDPLAIAVASGVIKVVTGCIQPYLQKWTSRSLRRVARKIFKHGTRLTLETLLEEHAKESGRLSKCEVMALAMSDTKLADLVDGYNSYTLNKVNGLVENTEMMHVGPWLTGRLTKDCDGVWWQTGRNEPVLVSTEDDVSIVRKASMASMRESDELGQWMA